MSNCFSRPSDPAGSSAGGTAATTTTPCTACTITSETVATQPADRTRTKIGVGEEVTLTFSLGAATWSVAGGGTLSSTSGATVTYTAPDTAASVTVTATGSGCTNTISLTVVAPDSVAMTRRPGSGVEHNLNYTNIGIQASIFIGPDDVNFYKIKFRELEIGQTSTGCYACLNGTGHHPNASALAATSDVRAGLGTEMGAFDTIYSGHCVTAPHPPPPPPPNTVGSAHFAIPWEYQVGSGPFHAIATVDHRIECAADGTLTASKVGATGTTTLTSPDSHY